MFPAVRWTLLVLVLIVLYPWTVASLYLVWLLVSTYLYALSFLVLWLLPTADLLEGLEAVAPVVYEWGHLCGRWSEPRWFGRDS